MIEELMVLSHCILRHFIEDTPGKIKDVLKRWKALLLEAKKAGKGEPKEKK